MNRPKAWQILIAILMLAAPASADLVWPALYLETRLLAWWVIAVGLGVEFLFIWRLFAFEPRKALIVDLGANLASTILGIMLIPLAGFAWEIFPGILLFKMFKIGTFNPGTWTATFIFAVIINAAIESLTIKWAFKTKIGQRGFWGLVIANAISVGIAFGSLFTNRPEL